MATTIVITIKTARSSADAAKLIKSTTQPRDEARAIEHFFKRLGAGLENASFDVQTSASAPVRASGTYTLTFGSISNNDTVVVAGTTLTAVTGTPAGPQFKILTNATITAANLAALINSNTTTNKLVSATSALGVVTVTALVPGVIGNKLTIVGSTGIVASGATLASGVGGTESTATNYSRGL